MSDFNQCLIGGKLGKEPEYRETRSGKGFCKFSIANDQSYKRKDGEWENTTIWVNCVMWGGGARLFADMYGKGDSVVVMGKWDTNTDNDGKVWTQLKVVEFQKKPRKRNDSSGVQGQGAPQGFDSMRRDRSAPKTESPSDYGGGPTGGASFPDDVPF